MNNKLLTDQWKSLEAHTSYYWQLLETMPESQLKYQPAPDKWSILQVTEHLLGAEESSLYYLKKKNYTPLATRSILPAPIRSILLNIALRSPLKFKAPKVEALVPYNTTPPAEVLQRWKEVRKQLALYLEQAPKEAVGKPLFRHPFAGALSLPQMLQFMVEHLDHHRRQIRAILAHKEPA